MFEVFVAEQATASQLQAVFEMVVVGNDWTMVVKMVQCVAAGV